MIIEYTFLSSTCRTLRKSDHKLAIKQLLKIPKKCFKKENKLLSKSPNPTKNGKKKKKKEERGREIYVFGNGNSYLNNSQIKKINSI